MSKFRNALTVTAAAAVLGGSALIAGSAPAEAASGYCVSDPSITCSMYWAKVMNPAQAKYGLSSGHTYALQKALQGAKINIVVNKRFDAKTRAALIEYQRTRKIGQSGVVDGSTVHALRVGAGAKLATRAAGGTSPKPGGASGSCVASNYWEPQPTASGERFNPNAMTAAHKTLPLGTRLKVTNTATGKSVVVRINDRGPYVGGRCLDLSRGAFAKIAPVSAGIARVTYVQV